MLSTGKAPIRLFILCEITNGMYPRIMEIYTDMDLANREHGYLSARQFGGTYYTLTEKMTTESLRYS